MSTGARDPYERMLHDAIKGFERANEELHAIALKLNTAESERSALFEHVDTMRKEVAALRLLAHGDGNGHPGYGARITQQERRIDALEKRLGESYDLAKLRWWAIGTIIAALGSVAAHIVR